MIEAKKVKCLAVMGENRADIFPDVPTLKELGYVFVSETVHTIVGPAGLPPDVVKKLEVAFKKGTETPEFKAALEKLFGREHAMHWRAPCAAGFRTESYLAPAPVLSAGPGGSRQPVPFVVQLPRVAERLCDVLYRSKSAADQPRESRGAPVHAGLGTLLARDRGD